MNRKHIASMVIKCSKTDISTAYSVLAEYLSGIDDEVFLNNLGLTFYQHVEYELAKQTFKHALKKFPNNHYLYNNYGLTLNRLGCGADAVEQYRKAVNIKADYHQARSNLAYTLLYFGKTDRSEILQSHKDIDTFAFSERTRFFDPKKIPLDSERPLNIAYISSDLRDHAVGRFMTGILKHHDTDHFNVHILDNRVNNNDETAQQLKTLHSSWIDISAMSTVEVCQLIVKLKIDILIDLSGHTKGGRPDVCSQRTAPLQINYLGYPATTGLENIDYRIVDTFTDPETLPTQTTEQLLHLNHAIWNYQTWQDMPSHSSSPYKENGYITFGSANNHAKLQEPWLKTWAKVLSLVPNSRLNIKSRSLKSPVAQQQLLQLFQNQKIDQSRIHIEHYSANKSNHWSTLQKFDIALDSFPYNGTTTSCDLLNLGIPIVTRAGNSHVSRTTGSILNTLGLNDWIAGSTQEFIDICISKARNINELDKLRQSLKIRFDSSTLGNPNVFLIEYEQKLRQCWRNYCLQKR